MHSSWIRFGANLTLWVGVGFCAVMPLLGAVPDPPKDAAAPVYSPGHTLPAQTNALSPVAAAKSFTVPDDLEIEQVLAEPIVRKPVHLSFDERGRLWVVQYLQYPAPAGLTVVSHDRWWRAVYDKVPEPPPRGLKGLDK